MQPVSVLRQRWLVFGLALLVLASCEVLGVWLGPQPIASQRLQAEQRWHARTFSSYRIAIRVEYAGDVCSQELETQGEDLLRIIHNDCRPNWLGLATVRRLFEIGERLERPEPCYSLPQTCTCARVRQGDIAYDAQLGYPLAIAYRREIRPNFLNADYWRRLIVFKQLPTCGPIDQQVRIAVMALTPIE